MEKIIKKTKGKDDRFFLEVFKGMSIYILLFSLLMKIITSVHVVGESMNPTIYDGETLLVNKAYKNFKHGHIVILYDEKINSTYILKRIIAIEGDYLYIDAGKVFLNGDALNEPYINESKCGYYSGTIPKREFFLMGDNRGVSCDSRHFGLINSEQIKGKIIFK